MTSFDFVAYMELLATGLKSLKHDADGQKHFYRVSSLVALDELLQGLNQAQFPALCVIDAPEGRFTDRDSSNLLDVQYYYFFVLQKADIDDAASRQLAISESRVIVRQLFGKMFRDRHNEQINPSLLPTYGLANLNRDSISYRAVGPIADNCYGLWASFTVTNSAGITYVDTDWNF